MAGFEVSTYGRFWVSTEAQSGFEYWDEEGDGRGFWFCRYCGSNHVTIALEEAAMLKEQADLYGRDGLLNS